MSTPPPVPYQAYKSKRHSRGLSSQLTPNVSPPPHSRPPSHIYLNGGSATVVAQRHDFSPESDSEKSTDVNGSSNGLPGTVSVLGMIPHHPQPVSAVGVHLNIPSDPPSPVDKNGSPETPPIASSGSASGSQESTPPSPPTVLPSSSLHFPQGNLPSSINPNLLDTSTDNAYPNINTNSHAITSSPSPSPLSPLPSTSTLRSTHVPRKASTFRHIPVRSSKSSLPSSPLRPQGVNTHSRTPSTLSTRQLEPAPASKFKQADTPNHPSQTTSSPSHERTLPAIPSLSIPQTSSPHASSTSSPSSPHTPARPEAATRRSAAHPPQPPPKSPSPQHSHFSPSPAHTPPSAPSPAPSSGPVSRAHTPRYLAPYRPGFQPQGVYWPRTDEFIDARRAFRDVGRIERTRLERRLEKLIHLHFPPPTAESGIVSKDKEKHSSQGKEGKSLHPPPQPRRASSFFDLDLTDLRGKSAGELWRGVLQAQMAGGKADVRAAEQTITPWEDDAAVSHCPLCSASFHPLTNRKHHCRLCGRIICSLPVKHPQRPQQCSLLFVADPHTGAVEEVGEGVDYGVRRRTPVKGKTGEDTMSDDEKFLKGVRICRECRPVLLRRQYVQDAQHAPLFVRLYEAFISLEKEIEDALPQFQELMLSLSKDERPTPEASGARKRLLEAFSQYDALAKRIRNLPCPGGPGSSQDRVQLAVVARANIFLQKHMFPLQSLPAPKKKTGQSSGAVADAEPEAQVIDPNSEIALALQPLLEQEALLESFVEEAQAHRKFEDARTLKANLQEIRAEIDRMVVNAENGMASRGDTLGMNGSRKGKARSS